MSWFERAACRGMATRLFFPERGEPCAEALAVCRRCPVVNQCLEYCLSLPRPDKCPPTPGVWGGTTGYQRDKLGLRREWHRKDAA